MRGLVDMHCHILPEVDDGAEDLKTAIRMLAEEQRNGVTKVILTPHFRRGMFETKMPLKRKQFQRLKAAVKHYEMNIQLYFGCEYHAGRHMIDRLDQESGYRMNGSRYVLIEFSSTHSYDYVRERLYRLLSNGYCPIVAHLERYECFYQEFDRVNELLRMGVHIQITAAAVLGQMGYRQKRFCKKLLKRGLVHYIASDAHDLGKRRVNLQECATYVEKKYGRELAEEVFIDNPEKILRERKAE
ncbi:protein-tyrosine phosphatase [Lachnospiraceae bacterium PM6-15]|uniref:CpsB/CapC family capsule biosynthesis tyrosine phosphatase n=1 Tax=Ohessyouella blattaphilus TaxID=2949333 RepID=UPI003E1B8ADB